MRNFHVLQLAICLAVTSAFAGPKALVCDFSKVAPAGVSVSSDKQVTVKAARETRNDLDGSSALEITATLAGPGAGWAGCSLPVPKGALQPGADTLSFDARSAGGSVALYLTITEADGARWNANVRIAPEWQHYEIPVYRFRWFMGPANREKTRPVLANAVSIDPWVGSMVQGPNGFAVDNIAVEDAQPAVRLHVVSGTTLPLQRTSKVILEAVGNSSGVSEPYSGELLLDVADRNEMNVPLRVQMKNGRGEFDVFPRRPGTIDLTLFEPYSGAESSVPLHVVHDGLWVDFSFPGFDGQQVVFINEFQSPRLRLQGNSVVPYSAHFALRDHTGRLVHSEWLSVPDIHAGKARIAVAAAGLLTAEMKLAAEPLYALPHMSYDPFLADTDSDKTTSAPQIPPAMPEGITTTSVIGQTVKLEPIPTTATIVGEDRFTVWAFVRSPTENILYKSPFGICSGALFHLPINDIATTGARRLEWHRRTGSLWGRNDLWWNEIEPVKGSMQWAKADKVVSEYRNRKINLLGILCYASKWSGGKAPADDTARGQWAQYVGAVAKRFAGKIKAFEVWNEPNQGFWAPAPDVNAYRELVRTTHEAVRKVSKVPRIVAGATAGFDPVFLNRMMDDGYTRYFDVVSFHPYPERHYESPDDNYLGEQCDAVREILRAHDAVAKEVWITETGWPTYPGGVTELEQANYLTRAYTIALAHRLTKVFWFDLYDWERYAWRGGWDSHLGLLDSNYRPKPSATAYQLVEYMMAQIYPRGTTRQGKATIYSFDIILHSRKWPGVLHIAWTPNSGDEEEVELPVVSGGPLFVFDYLGAERPAELVSVEGEDAGAAGDDHVTTAGLLRSEDAQTTRTYRFHINHEPLYIWDSGATPRRPDR